LVALRRLEPVEDCAKVVEFLATDLSDYATGAVIPIDGGLVEVDLGSPEGISKISIAKSLAVRPALDPKGLTRSGYPLSD
jgi:hypothetical protein